MGKSHVKIYFSSPRQVYRYLTVGIGEEFIWGDKQVAVKEKGVVYKVSEKTIYNHTDDSEGKQILRPRRRVGGFAKRTVDQYARVHLTKVIEVSGEPEEEQRTPGAAERRTQADAELKTIEARRRNLKLQEELGLLVPVAVIESELGERAQALKLHLMAFMRDVKPQIISLFGGDFQVASEIISLVSGDKDKAEALSGYMFSKSATLLDLYKRRLLESLNTYASGEWFTEEMQVAWNKFQSAQKNEQVVVCQQFIKMVQGNPEQLEKTLSLFDVRLREEI